MRAERCIEQARKQAAETMTLGTNDWPTDCRQKEVTIQGSPFLLRYDDTYHFYRPPRAHHCTETNVVVEKFDHFCPWVGNTIGARNYVHFVRFLASALLLTATTMGFCVLRITQHVQRVSADGNSFLDSLLDIVAAPLIVLYCICALSRCPSRSVAAHLLHLCALALSLSLCGCALAVPSAAVPKRYSLSEEAVCLGIPARRRVLACGCQVQWSYLGAPRYSANLCITVWIARDTHECS